MIHLPAPEGSRRIVVKAGSEVRGTRYFRDTALNVSTNFADYLVAEGLAREDTEPGDSQ